MSDPDPVAARPLAGMLCVAASIACFLLTAILGPSVMEPALSGRPGQPPYSLVVRPSPYPMVVLVAAGIMLGALGLALCGNALRRGWSFEPRRLLIAGALIAVAFMFMPPVGSGDHLNYAAYGRMAVTGHNPYVTGARDLRGDPIADRVEPPWTKSPTVYGPIATAEQSFASLIGGHSVRLTVFVMSVINVVAFIVTGLLLHRMAHGNQDRQMRAALLWTANPLVLFALVGGAHNDVIAIAFAVAGLVMFAGGGRPTPATSAGGARAEQDGVMSRAALAGLFLGVAAAVKLNAAIVGGGPAWVLLRDRWSAHRSRDVRFRRVAMLAGTSAAVAGSAYLLAGPHSLDPLNQASKMVSLATPWHLVDKLLGVGAQRSLIQTASIVLTAALAVLLLRALPRLPGHDGETVAAQTGETAVRVAAALVLAWLFATPYALPWYDGLGWATLALLPWSRFDWLLLARTTLLALAYLPARDPGAAQLPADLHWLITVERSEITPWASTLLLGVLIVVSLRPPPAFPGHVRSPRAPVESPR